MKVPPGKGHMTDVIDNGQRLSSLQGLLNNPAGLLQSAILLAPQARIKDLPALCGLRLLGFLPKVVLLSSLKPPNSVQSKQSHWAVVTTAILCHWCCPQRLYTCCCSFDTATVSNVCRVYRLRSRGGTTRSLASHSQHGLPVRSSAYVMVSKPGE